MKKALRLLLMATIAIVSLSNAASAQKKCPGGQAANGDCVNEILATSATQAAVIFSQPKISLSAYPILPRLDRIYRYPDQLNPNQLPSTRVGTQPPPPPSVPPPPPPPGGGGGGGGGGGPSGD
jgi:hypothetical protein